MGSAFSARGEIPDLPVYKAAPKPGDWLPVYRRDEGFQPAGFPLVQLGLDGPDAGGTSGSRASA